MMAIIYWNLSKIVESGYLKRVRKGVYAFNEWKGKTKITLTDEAKRVQDHLEELSHERKALISIIVGIRAFLFCLTARL